MNVGQLSSRVNIMYLGHVTTTTCLYQGLERLKVRLPFLPFLLGALFPDLIDKPLALLTGLPGRGMFHSAVVLSALFLALLMLFPRKRELTNAFFVGTMLHLIQDIPVEFKNILWPFLGPLEYTEGPSILERFWQYYVEIALPVHWAVELISLPWFLTILGKNGKRSLVRASLP